MSNPCSSISNLIESLKAEAASLAAELSTASPSEKPAIAAQIKGLKAQIAAEKKKLAACIETQLDKQPLVPVTIAMSSLQSHVETNEVRADEPYILVTAADLSSIPPSVETVLYGPWGNVNAGNTKFTTVPTGGPVDAILASLHLLRQPFWSLDGQSKKISEPEKVIFIAALMEHDDGEPSAARMLVKSAATVSLVDSTSLPRAQRIAKLIDDIHGALGTPTGFPNFDDRVGKPRELVMTGRTLKEAGFFGSVTRSLEFQGDGGSYTLLFEIKKV
jgi:hypothetical protein